MMIMHHHLVDVCYQACIIQVNVQDGGFHPGVICVPAVVQVALKHLKHRKQQLISIAVHQHCSIKPSC